jgi:Ca-activated chloride channel family protein
VIKVPPSPQTLRKLSAATGGEQFDATNAENLADVYKSLGSRLGHKKESRELTDLFAGGAGALLLVGGGLSALWFRRVP